MIHPFDSSIYVHWFDGKLEQFALKELPRIHIVNRAVKDEEFSLLVHGSHLPYPGLSAKVVPLTVN